MFNASLSKDACMGCCQSTHAALRLPEVLPEMVPTIQDLETQTQHELIRFDPIFGFLGVCLWICSYLLCLDCMSRAGSRNLEFHDSCGVFGGAS